MINKRIALFLGNDYELGEWFLRPLVDAKDSDEAAASLAELWRTSVMDIEDYFVGRADQLSVVLGYLSEATAALVIVNPDNRQVEVGASASIRGNPSAHDADVIKLLKALVKSAALLAMQSPGSADGEAAQSAEEGELTPGGDRGDEARD